MEVSNETQIALILQKLGIIEAKVDKIESKMDTIEHDFKMEYVTKTEFTPVRNIVYGMVGVIMLAVLGGILALIFK